MVFYFNFIFLILLYLPNLTKYLCNELHYFEFNLVADSMKTSTYISLTKSSDGYLYILTGNDEDFPNRNNRRYLLKMDLETLSLHLSHNYSTLRGFYGGEIFSFSAKNKYLFIPTYSGPPLLGSLEILNLEIKTYTIGTINNDSSIYGRRRSFMKSGSYYYFIHLDNKKQLYAKKMKIDGYDDVSDSPKFKIIQENKEINTKSREMISCDLTYDKNYILCAYYDEYEQVRVAVFNSALKIEKRENYGKTSSFTGLDFIKILYFKGTSNFILMYSQSESVTRLRYFNYQYNNFYSKIGSLIGSSNDYLDIYDTQINGNYGNNDIAISGTDKVIKIFGKNSGNDIIITIIQFYQSDSYITIKIYNMRNENGFNYFLQSRISSAKNSIVFCASAIKNNIRMAGYSLINFPNVNDTILWGRGISVERCGLKIKSIFNVNAKLKILSIPNGIIFYNYLNSKRIYKNDELEINDGLSIKEYKINRGFDYIIKYQGIARGNDSGYDIIKKYPTNKDIKNYNEILIEGRKGQLTINITTCLNGFYPLEDDLNLCTTFKYSGYYLDRIDEMYKRCPSPCMDCDTPINSTHKNCITCKSGYYLTEDTKYCYNEIIENYYKDGNMLRRCHKNCLYCSTGTKNDTNMKCTKCYSNWY